jgi:hypothetical protein
MPGFQSLPLKVVLGVSKPIGEMHENFTPYLQICYSLYLLKTGICISYSLKITKALDCILIVLPVA